MMRKVITIDGLAGSGKTTLARELAKKTGFMHLNSGLLYRGVAFLCLNAGISPRKETQIVSLVANKLPKLEVWNSEPRLIIENTDLTLELQGPDVSEAASLLSVHAGVRQLLLDAQKNAFPGYNLIAEGRDMGTVVFPAAHLKFFIQVDTQTRVTRRIKQLQNKGQSFSPSDIEREIIERDARDSERSVSPTVAASDAVGIDNSKLDLTQVVEIMYTAALAKGILS